MKIKLNGRDRLTIPRLLPEKGTLVEQATVKEVLEMVALKSADFKKYGIQEDERTKMLIPDCLDPEKNPLIALEEEFDLTKPHVQLMKKQVKEKDDAGEITQFLYDTCVKINEMRG